jgi:predicted TIM-barrel fold metal-dependent hydrolase
MVMTRSNVPGSLCDADSHLMESPGWLATHADPEARDLMGSLELAAAGAEAQQAMQQGLDRVTDERVTEVDPAVLSGPKGWVGIGAMDATERSAVLDALDISAQLVFSTFATAQFGFSEDEAFLYAGTRAHNRGMTAFCGSDSRLLAVGFVPLADVERSVGALDEALAMGCAGIWVPHRLAGGVSPGHLQWDPFWARLEEARIPFLLHVGGGRSRLSRGFHDNGRPLPPDFIGGGENVRGKDFPSIHHSAETMLSVMILDGVFDRFPDLRGGAIELGASWVPGFLQRLDSAQRNFGRRDPVISSLELNASDYVRRNLRFTPYAFDDVGWLIQQVGRELFLFSTDYPHPEGGRDPIGKFVASMGAAGIDASDEHGFWTDNFRHLVGASSDVQA